MGDGEGGVPRDSRRAIYEPPTGVTGSSGKAGEDRCPREASVRVGWMQGEKSKKWAVCVLKTGQRRDVQVNVATFQRLLKIYVATLRSHVATFQRV